MAFGKRKVSPREAIAAIPRPQVDDDGVTRKVPKSAFAGKHGEFFRQIGMSPDDPSNLAPTQELIDARFDRMREQQDKFVERVNAQMPGTTSGVEVIPWAMLPWSLWKQEHASWLLVACEFYPLDPLNTMLLPADKKSAFILDLPEHKRSEVAGLNEAANRLIGELRARFDDVFKNTAVELHDGNIDALTGFQKKRHETLSSLVGIAHVLGAMTYGEKAFERHRQMFAKTLGWQR